MKSSNQLKAGALLSYVNLAISTVIPLLYTPVMLRILGQAEYGLFSLSNSVISYLSLLTLGLGSAFSRYYMRYMTAGDKGMMRKVSGLFLVMYSAIGVLTVIIGAGITFFTGSLFAKGLLPDEISKLNILIIIMAVSAAISLIAAPYGMIGSCHERFVFQKLVALSGTIVMPIINLVMLYAGFGSIGMAIANIVIQLISLIVSIYYCASSIGVSPQIHDLPWGMLKDLFNFALFVFIGMIADMLYWVTDKVLLGALVGSAAVAVYNIGVTFNTMLQQLSSAISSVFSPRVNQMVFSKVPISEVSDLMIRVGRIQYLIISLALSGFVAFGQDFLHFWAGNEYEEAYYVALLTMIPMSIPLMQNIAFTTIVAQNKHHFRSVLYVVLAVVNAISTYLLIPVMGIIGAALCTFIVFLLGHGLIMNGFYYKNTGLDIPRFWKNIVRMTGVPVLMIICVFVLRHLGMTTDSLGLLLIEIIIYAIVFGALSWHLTMNRYEQDLALSMVRKVFRRRT